MGTVVLPGAGAQIGQALERAGPGIRSLIYPHRDEQRAIQHMALADPEGFDQFIAKWRKDAEGLGKIVGNSFAQELLEGTPRTETEIDQQALNLVISGKRPNIRMGATGAPIGIEMVEVQPGLQEYVRAARAAGTTPKDLMYLQVLADLDPDERQQFLLTGKVGEEELEVDPVQARMNAAIFSSDPTGEAVGKYTQVQINEFTIDPSSQPDMVADAKRIRMALGLEPGEDPEADIISARRISDRLNSDSSTAGKYTQEQIQNYVLDPASQPELGADNKRLLKEEEARQAVIDKAALTPQGDTVAARGVLKDLSRNPATSGKYSFQQVMNFITDPESEPELAADHRKMLEEEIAADLSVAEARAFGKATDDVRQGIATMNGINRGTGDNEDKIAAMQGVALSLREPLAVLGRQNGVEGLHYEISETSGFFGMGKDVELKLLDANGQAYNPQAAAAGIVIPTGGIDVPAQADVDPALVARHVNSIKDDTPQEQNVYIERLVTTGYQALAVAIRQQLAEGQ